MHQCHGSQAAKWQHQKRVHTCLATDVWFTANSFRSRRATCQGRGRLCPRAARVLAAHRCVHARRYQAFLEQHGLFINDFTASIPDGCAPIQPTPPDDTSKMLTGYDMQLESDGIWKVSLCTPDRRFRMTSPWINSRSATPGRPSQLRLQAACPASMRAASCSPLR